MRKMVNIPLVALLEGTGMALEDMTTEHLERLNLRNTDERVLHMLGTQAEFAAHALKCGPCFALVQVGNGAVVGCGGFAYLCPGVCEAWLVGSSLFRVHPRLVLETCKRNVQYMINLGVHRVQAHVRADNPAAARFIGRHMGFAYEGLCHAYGPDKATYLRFARWT